MGTVHLTSGHHNLVVRKPQTDFEQRIKLDPAWLERPILMPGGTFIGSEYERITTAALRALLALPVDSAVSYEVVGTALSPNLSQPHRVWGELTLGGPANVIVAFSHDSRLDNAPYRYLHQWPEDQGCPSSDAEEDERFWREWSDPHTWEIFFKLRLRQAANQMREKAKQMQQEAGAIQRKANKISSLVK